MIYNYSPILFLGPRGPLAEPSVSVPCPPQRIFSFSNNFPPFPSLIFISSVKENFLSTNTFLLFLLLFRILRKKIFPLSKYFPSPSFLRDIESILPISPDILSHIKNQLVDLFSPIWSRLILGKDCIALKIT